ncbi:sulfurtransferase [Winogradskyella psychrotolerans]|uniref:sulfurtransferase n=1 Tax=Winogradskyella psychrotolerans TaxID=1344585 RepID=UPI001C06706A|nr:sulfurtransferase [Winogradskyella psychrotolerans]MBU2927174.1 sulfurtransferase [Winogradskyella psychrotolerans]
MKIDQSSNLVSVEWLKDNHNANNLIILDATINKVIDEDSMRISNARFVDIKQRFSDTSAPFPSTLPSKEQFQNEARAIGINQDSMVVVYDDKGIYSSARVWWLFKVFGFENVAVLDGGLPKWKNHEYNIETYSDDTYAEGNFIAHFNPTLMTDFEGINEFSNSENVVIIDARSEARFNCSVDEPRVGLRRGTIPNSINLPYTELFNGNILKPITELSIIFNRLVEDKKPLVFSCGSGITACILALAATLCNYTELIVYDGSWTEYGSLTLT